MTLNTRRAGLPLWFRPLILMSSIPLFGLGIGAMFVPDQLLDVLDLSPRGIYGYNTIRSDIGGLLIASGLMMVIGLYRQNSTWFLATALTMGVILLGRTVSFLMDGPTSAAIPAVVVELVVTVVTVTAHRLTTRETSKTG